MKYNHCQGMKRLPLSVIHSAQAGDAEAIEQVLRHNEIYINKLCTRKLYGEGGYPHECLDEYMKRRLEIKLIQAIVTTSWRDGTVGTAYPFPVLTARSEGV